MTEEELIMKWRALAKAWIDQESSETSKTFMAGFARGLESAAIDVEIHLIGETVGDPCNDNNNTK
jgi:hypothetical protein